MKQHRNRVCYCFRRLWTEEVSQMRGYLNLFMFFNGKSYHFWVKVNLEWRSRHCSSLSFLGPNTVCIIEKKNQPILKSLSTFCLLTCVCASHGHLTHTWSCIPYFGLIFSLLPTLHFAFPLDISTYVWYWLFLQMRMLSLSFRTYSFTT